MTDLEITKLCAEAFGHTPVTVCNGVSIMLANGSHYRPLHDDAQAMALVKKFRMEIIFDIEWRVGMDNSDEYSRDDDLNTAICKCVAEMQAAKQGEKPAPLKKIKRCQWCGRTTPYGIIPEEDCHQIGCPLVEAEQS